MGAAEAQMGATAAQMGAAEAQRGAAEGCASITKKASSGFSIVAGPGETCGKHAVAEAIL